MRPGTIRRAELPSREMLRGGSDCIRHSCVRSRLLVSAVALACNVAGADRFCLCARRLGDISKAEWPASDERARRARTLLVRRDHLEIDLPARAQALDRGGAWSL